jgi:hypothetical protein
VDKISTPPPLPKWSHWEIETPMLKGPSDIPAWIIRALDTTGCGPGSRPKFDDFPRGPANSAGVGIIGG